MVAGGKILPLLFECVQDHNPDVRQSAFALLGDLARACIVSGYFILLSPFCVWSWNYLFFPCPLKEITVERCCLLI